MREAPAARGPAAGASSRLGRVACRGWFGVGGRAVGGHAAAQFSGRSDAPQRIERDNPPAVVDHDEAGQGGRRAFEQRGGVIERDRGQVPALSHVAVIGTLAGKV